MITVDLTAEALNRFGRFHLRRLQHSSQRREDLIDLGRLYNQRR
jgi:hypothetical protein